MTEYLDIIIDLFNELLLSQRKAFERINRQAHAAAYEDRHMRQENMIKRRFLKRIANVKIASAFVKLREGGHRAKYEMHVHELTQVYIFSLFSYMTKYLTIISD
tara:strand:+ start:342 stop:653 length:312 start_codon:yes stop_codon:yes gene_type:complete